MPDRVIAALNLKRGEVVADIGAGTGYFSVRLAKSEAAPKVYAVDIEPQMVSYLRERAAKEGLKNVGGKRFSAPALPPYLRVRGGCTCRSIRTFRESAHSQKQALFEGCLHCRS